MSDLVIGILMIIGGVVSGLVVSEILNRYDERQRKMQKK